jgi:hypothetical protein
VPPVTWHGVVAEELIKREQEEGPLAGPDTGVWLTAAAGGSQTIRFERFTLQASTSGGGIDMGSNDAVVPGEQLSDLFFLQHVICVPPPEQLPFDTDSHLCLTSIVADCARVPPLIGLVVSLLQLEPMLETPELLVL